MPLKPLIAGMVNVPAASFGSLGGAVADNAALVTALALKLDKAGGAFTGLTGAGFRDTSAAFDVTQTFTSSTALDAGRSITWDVKNASHQLKFTAASIVTFPAGTNTLLGSAVANTITTNGAASTPALLGSGTIFTGGSATTTKPYWLIEPVGTTSTGWSTGGTGLGVNLPTAFASAGRLADFQVNGSSKVYIDGVGNGVVSPAFSSTGSLTLNPSLGSAGAYMTLGNNLGSIGNIRTVLQDSHIYIWSGYQLLLAGTRASASDVGVSWGSAGVAKITDGSTGRGTLDAAGYQVGGVAGVSGTITAASTVTVVNGIVTVIA